MVVLGVVEGPGGLDLGRHRVLAGGPQRLVVGVAGHLRRRLLGVVGEVDARAVLGADVVALAHALGRVVLLEEDLQQVGVGDLLRVEGDQHRLGVAGLRRADLLVGRVRGGPVLVADRRRVDAVEFPEQPLRAPEAAEREVGDLDPLRERRLQRRARAPRASPAPRRPARCDPAAPPPRATISVFSGCIIVISFPSLFI